MPKSADASMPVHPLIAKLTEGGVGPGASSPQAPAKLSGYIGPASQPGMVRLYSSLRDLSHYLEFPQGAVVHTAEAPESLLPDGAVSVWIKPDTPFRWTREYPHASALTTALFNVLRQFASPGSFA
jgi:hypothetical protein